MAEPQRLILGITGATGMVYVQQFLELLRIQEIVVHAIISDAGRQVLRLELGMEATLLPGVQQWFDFRDFTAPMASGSCPYRAMVVLPCTMGTLGAIASGAGSNLIHRAADVSLKEKRPLVLAARETPLNKIHLQNMLTLHEAGAIICPPMPSFYQHPRTVEEMARNFAARICDQIGVATTEVKRWQGVEDVQ